MSENMQELKRRMKSIESTEHITNAMRLVSASKYKKAKNVFDRTSAQIQEVSHTMGEIVSAAQNALQEKEEEKKVCDDKDASTILILITSGRGLCGGFNANLTKKALSCVAEIPKDKLEIYAIGSKGREFFEHNGYKIIGECEESAERITFAAASEIARPLIEKYRNGEAAQVLLVYTKYINSLKQEPVVKKLMPLDPEEFAGSGRELEFPQDPKEVLEYMIPKYFELTLFEAAMESAACEHAARRSAMENATDNANEILAKLSLTYNRVRQAAITNELIEIVSGAESQK